MDTKTRADELDERVQLLRAGAMLDLEPEWCALHALVDDLCELPSAVFRQRLKAELIEEGGIDEPLAPKFEQVAGVGALAEVLPSLTGNSSRIFPADQRSFLFSFLSHTALIVLIASGIWVSSRPVEKRPLLTSQLTFVPEGNGGGGSGDRGLVPVTKGAPPRMIDRQLTPPVVVARDLSPKLPVEPTLVAPPNVKLPQSTQIGDLISSNVAIPSNGTGSGGGAGDGSGTGLGGGSGIGAGPGLNFGLGGGRFTIGKGVVAPRAIYDPDPEYSEEARKLKQQGTVILSLVVDEQGRPRDIRVARSLGMGLDEKAIEAVRTWKFVPGSKDGIPVAVRVNVEVSFRLY